MRTRLKVTIALARLGFTPEECNVLAELVVWTLEQEGEARGWMAVTAEIVERYQQARAVMASADAARAPHALGCTLHEHHEGDCMVARPGRSRFTLPTTAKVPS